VSASRGGNGGLTVVIRLARETERATVERLRAVRERCAVAEEQLRAVEDYLAEYLARAAAGGVRHARDVLEERRFLAQLQASVIAQRRVADESGRQLEGAQRHWLAARRKREALEALAAERARGAARTAERKVQQQLDDRPRPGRQLS
jgi:flagellar export protein FliJ